MTNVSHKFLGSVLFLLAVGMFMTACELEVNPNRDSIPEGSAIYGTVVAEAAVTGDVVLARYDCHVPPPPASTGRPVDFIVVPRIEFVNNEAPFIFPLVDAGQDAQTSECYLIQGWMDSDHNWNPFYGVTGQTTQGDVFTPVVTVEVYGAADGETVPLVEDVVIPLDTPVLYDRPSYEIMASKTTDMLPEDPQPPFQLQLGIQNEDGDPYDLLYSEVHTYGFTSPLLDNTDPKFSLVFADDADGNGFPEDYNGDGISDVLWPRILMLRLDPEDPTRLLYSAPTTIIPGVVLPFNPPGYNGVNHLMDYMMAGGVFDGETILWVDDLNFVVPELVVTNLETSETDLLTTLHESAVAAGDPLGLTGEYQVLVMNVNGQLWQNPNEITTLVDDLTEEEIALQNQVLTVVE